MKNKVNVMIPGPTPVNKSILDQMGRETVAFLDANFVKEYKQLIIDLKKLWRTDGECFVISGSGTLAMEMAIANTTKVNDNVLIISHGYFGDRFIDMCERRQLNVDTISSEWGKTVDLDIIEKALASKHYDVMTVTHVDTSTGTKSDLKAISEISKKFKDTLLIVDGVCSTAAEREYIDEMGIDVLVTCSQKAFGVPPGLAILWAGQKAILRRTSLGKIPESYIDFEKWMPIMNDPSKYWGTPPVNLVWAMSEAVRLIKNEGLEERFNRHEKDAKAIQKALISLGFGILADESNRASTLTNAIYPEGIIDADFREILVDEGIIVAGGLGAFAGKLFRIGHMGNIDKHIIISAISAIERALERSGFKNKLGVGTKTYLEEVVK
ncbi:MULTISPECIES: alanine--glyoxylate aminotransferase family protein [unclassified Fusibacter]|uniref:pyridoxal-phosphate-dependent aminotransferase family protein n=1 Tax=unclassified Fusibacter TaxID=2624464 RepID=UPI0010101399|nr:MULTISPECIES: alanine--glyoxylate aminotransferase family protein [unclassified Fusibacter]MCK8058438.1 alanine--glyoxylate aminotransferase family protein [Fusibacter sp. A2]NPE22794.1 alanine--glyoxylate aminotransferase family protein [Fusibacter sp. A1]RXV60350.1 alanine--glyoxylate aminotransferase family protein [Fusibacter sp. A1]